MRNLSYPMVKKFKNIRAVGLKCKTLMSNLLSGYLRQETESFRQMLKTEPGEVRIGSKTQDGRDQEFNSPFSIYPVRLNL